MPCVARLSFAFPPTTASVARKQCDSRRHKGILSMPCVTCTFCSTVASQRRHWINTDPASDAERKSDNRRHMGFLLNASRRRNMPTTCAATSKFGPDDLTRRHFGKPVVLNCSFSLVSLLFRLLFPPGQVPRSAILVHFAFTPFMFANCSLHLQPPSGVADVSCYPQVRPRRSRVTTSSETCCSELQLIPRVAAVPLLFPLGRFPGRLSSLAPPSFPRKLLPPIATFPLRRRRVLLPPHSAQTISHDNVFQTLLFSIAAFPLCRYCFLALPRWAGVQVGYLHSPCLGFHYVRKPLSSIAFFLLCRRRVLLPTSSAQNC